MSGENFYTLQFPLHSKLHIVMLKEEKQINKKGGTRDGRESIITSKSVYELSWEGRFKWD